MKRYLFTWEDGSNEIIEGNTKMEAVKRFDLVRAESGLNILAPRSIKLMREDGLTGDGLPVKVLKRMANLSREYDDLYSEMIGFVAVGEAYIHLNIRVFLETFSDYEITPRNSTENPEQLSATYNGVTFIAIR